MYLKHLSISGFRGIGSHLDLPLGQRTIIYGPNGSGKSSVLQAIAWSIYGKLPYLVGTVFAREDALVNDFFGDGMAEIVLSLSDGVTIKRGREKQGSTGRGKNPLTISFDADDPQSAVEQAIGLNSDEFFAAAFLPQETIREFITTTPDKRSATIDRMLGTYLLRTLVKVVDPGIPAKAIEEAQEAITQVDRQLAQASVISRDMIEQRKAEYGDPAQLPRILEDIQHQLTPLTVKLRLPVPESTLGGLESSLAAIRKAQLDTVSTLESQAGRIGMLKERYHNAAVTGWQSVRQRRVQYGDPADLPELLKGIQQELVAVAGKLALVPQLASVPDLQKTLAAIRQAQPTTVAQLSERVAQYTALKERYQQAAVSDWEAVNERRKLYGDPALLADLFREIQDELQPICGKLRLPTPRLELAELEMALDGSRRAQPGVIGRLEKRAGQLRTLKERYELTAAQIPETVTVPSELRAQSSQLRSQVDSINRDIPVLKRQLMQRQGVERELAELRHGVEVLPGLRSDYEQMERSLKDLKIAGKRGNLYNQVLSVGRDYLAEVLPDHCPLCKQAISDLNALRELLRLETPEDVEQLRRHYSRQQMALTEKREQILGLERSLSRIAQLEKELGALPVDLEAQITRKSEEGDRAARDLTAVETEIAGIQGRIRLAEEHRRRLDAVRQDIDKELGRTIGSDALGELDREIEATLRSASELAVLDFQPVTARLEQARQLSQIAGDEAQLRRRLAAIQQQIKEVLGYSPEGDVVAALENAIQDVRDRVVEVQTLDLEPVAAKLERAKQLRLIEVDEAQLRKQLEQVLEDAAKALGRPLGQNASEALDQAREAIHVQVTEIQALDLQPMVSELSRARQLSEIEKDQGRLQQYESNYQTASREKARLGYQIRRLTDLRNALVDIAETTKRHQQEIVMGVLNDLDIDRYYQQLDPHPAYRQLQIEPELTKEGTYEYWIKALTDDRSHGTYIQTRFSTAQANCAAIAIFLAVNQHLSKELETIILDDPSQSMDPEHQLRLAQTLASIPRQVIVATEDPRTLEMLAGAFDKPVIHELKPWTVGGTSLAK